MHIAQATPYYHPHVGGVESHVESIVRELVDRGHQVSVLTAQLPDAPAYEVLDGAQIHRIPTMMTAFNTPVMPRIASVIPHLDFDLVHTHTPPPVTCYHAARGADAADVPLVLTYHADLEIPYPGGEAIVWLYRKLMGRVAVDVADRLIATTETYRATSEALWDREVDVVPNPIEVDRFHPDGPETPWRDRLDIPADAPIALYVGRLVHHKGVEQFIEAATHLDDVHLLVAGDGPLADRLQAKARRTSDRVHMLGRVSDEELPGTYRAADMLCLPSISRLEAFGIVALEAMASGVPVVVSDIPGVREVIEPGETGLIADPLAPRDLADKIGQLADDPDRARAMGKRGRERVLERFSVATVVDALETIYDDVA